VNFTKKKVSWAEWEWRYNPERFVEILDCRVMSILFIYLRLPVGGNLKKYQLWEKVVGKVKERV